MDPPQHYRCTGTSPVIIYVAIWRGSCPLETPPKEIRWPTPEKSLYRISNLNPLLNFFIIFFRNISETFNFHSIFWKFSKKLAFIWNESRRYMFNWIFKIFQLCNKFFQLLSPQPSGVAVPGSLLESSSSLQLWLPSESKFRPCHWWW